MCSNKTTLFLLAGLLTVCFSLTACAGIHTITSRGKSYVPLANIAAYYGMTSSSPSKERVRLQNKWSKIEFQTDSRSRNVWIDGTLVLLSEPVRKVGWRWAIDTTDFNKTIEPAIRPYAFLKNAGSRVVVLDPGHGGKDKGTSSPHNVHEKVVVLDIAKRVEKILESHGIRVVLTRESDHFLTLDARCRKAAALKADLFVSIHANSAGNNRSVRGTEAFVLSLPGFYSSNSYGKGHPPASTHKGNHYDIANMALGFCIHRSLIKTAGLEDRGVKRARFQVLRDAPCPAALIETAFLSNPKNEAMLTDPAGRDRIARGIADGIRVYLANVSRAKTK